MIKLLNSKTVAALVSLCALGSVTNTATAAAVTDCGTNVCYTYNNTQLAVEQFGLPVIVGDAFVFLPESFRAESTDGVGASTGLNRDTVAANFVIEARSKTGESLLEVLVAEEGDYEVTNGDLVGARLRLTVVNMTPSDAVFPETGFSQVSFDSPGDSNGLQSWDLATAFDLTSEFDVATDAVMFSIQNTLFAETDENGENAWIQKKLVLTTTTVPIPAAVWLFASGLAILGAFRGRKTPV